MAINAVAARNEAVVREFIRGWDTLDIDLCMAQCTPEMVYLNQPLERTEGCDNVRKMIKSILDAGERAHFLLLTVMASGNKVVTERVDQWDWNGSGTWQLRLPLVGIFELNDAGKDLRVARVFRQPEGVEPRPPHPGAVAQIASRLCQARDRCPVTAVP